jgi:hypothetical protein
MSSFKKDNSSEFLQSQFPSRNSTIQWFNKKFCNWRWYPTLIRNPKDRGHPAPLWKNNSPDQYRIFYTLNLISSVIFVFFFCILQVYNISQNTSASSSTFNSTWPNNTIAQNSTNQNAGSIFNNTNGTNTNINISNNTNITNVPNNTNSSAKINNTLPDTFNNSTDKSQACFNLIQTQIQPHFIIIGSLILLVNGRQYYI